MVYGSNYLRVTWISLRESTADDIGRLLAWGGAYAGITYSINSAFPVGPLISTLAGAPLTFAANVNYWTSTPVNFIGITTGKLIEGARSGLESLINLVSPSRRRN